MLCNLIQELAQIVLPYPTPRGKLIVTDTANSVKFDFDNSEMCNMSDQR